jgi:hypothetical protein
MTENAVWSVRAFKKDQENWFSVESEILYVDFMEGWSWTFRNIKYMGKDIIIGEYGANGSVVRVDTGPGPKDYCYHGTSHGLETVKSLSIAADSRSYIYESGMSCSGNEVVIRKESNLGPLDHEAEITFPVSGDHLIEKHSFTVVEDLNKRFSFLFAFMHETDKALYQWSAMLNEGREIEGDLQNRIKGRIGLQSDIKSIIFYGPVEKKGVVYVYPQIYKGAGKIKSEMKNGTSNHFGTSIVDMNIGNSKLYFRPEVKNMGYNVGDTFEYGIKVVPFSAEPDEWKHIGKKRSIEHE